MATLPKGFLPIDWQEIAENQTVETEIVETEEEKVGGAGDLIVCWMNGEGLERKLNEG